MPLTLNQLKAKMRQNPEKFREDQQKLMDFSKTFYKGALQNERIAARPLSMRFGGKRQMSVEKEPALGRLHGQDSVYDNRIALPELRDYLIRLAAMAWSNIRGKSEKNRENVD